MEDELRRHLYIVPVLVGLFTSACPETKPTAEELFSRTKRIEIKIRMGGETSCPPMKPYVTLDPKEVAAVVSKVSVKPTGSAAAWMWPNIVTFSLAWVDYQKSRGSNNAWVEPPEGHGFAR